MNRSNNGNRTPRPKKFDEFKRKAFIELLEKGIQRVVASKQVGVDYTTVYKTLRADREFQRSVSEAEMHRDGKVENALYEAALNGNVTAIQVWLYNRCPDRWRDARGQGRWEVPQDQQKTATVVYDSKNWFNRREVIG